MQQRQAQILQMGMQALSQDPSIDLSKFLPNDTTLDVWNSLSALQQSKKKMQKEAEVAGPLGQVPSLLASKNPQDLSAAQQIMERAANLMRDPNNPNQIAPQLQDLSRQIALNEPLARVAQREAEAKARMEAEQKLPESVRTNLFAKRSGFLDNEQYADNIRSIARRAGSGTTTEFERLARKSAEGKASDLEELRLITLATGGNSQSITIGPDGTVTIDSGGGGAQKFLKQRMDVQDAIDSISEARLSIRSMAQTISQSPETAGIGARVLNTFQAGAGIAESMYSLTGSRVGFELIQKGQQALLAEAAMHGGIAKSDASRLGLIDKNGNVVSGLASESGLPSTLKVPRLEAEQTLLAYAMAGAVRTGTGRLTVRSVEEMKDLFNFKDIRGPKAFIAKLNKIDEILARRQETTKRRAAENFGMSFPTGEIGPIQGPRDNPEIPPNAGASPPAAEGAQSPVFVIRNGKLVPKNQMPQTPALPPLPPSMGNMSLPTPRGRPGGMR